MKAAAFTEHGDTDVIELIEVDKPEISSKDVRIKVHAFALNRLDLWTREGLPNLEIDFPHVGGSDFAGIIEEIGQDVIEFKVGDRVVVNATISCNRCEHCKMGEISLCDEFRLLGEHVWGGAAEYARAPARNLLKIPEHISCNSAAASALTLLTTYRMITTRANIRPGNTVLVTGSGGGIGTMAVQLAVLMGGNVIALTSSKEKEVLAKDLGAQHIINYQETPDWGKTVWQLTGKQGVDIVLDSAGEAVFKQAIRSLAKGGRYVTCGSTTGRKGEINLALLFWKQLSILGSSMASHAEFKEAMELLFKGKITPVIDSTYKLNEIKEAHLRLEDPEHTGKILVEINEN